MERLARGVGQEAADQGRLAAPRRRGHDEEVSPGRSAHSTFWTCSRIFSVSAFMSRTRAWTAGRALLDAERVELPQDFLSQELELLADGLGGFGGQQVVELGQVSLRAAGAPRRRRCGRRRSRLPARDGRNRAGTSSASAASRSRRFPSRRAANSARRAESSRSSVSTVRFGRRGPAAISRPSDSRMARKASAAWDAMASIAAVSSADHSVPAASTDSTPGIARRSRASIRPGRFSRAAAREMPATTAAINASSTGASARAAASRRNRTVTSTLPREIRDENARRMEGSSTASASRSFTVRSRNRWFTLRAEISADAADPIARPPPESPGAPSVPAALPYPVMLRIMGIRAARRPRRRRRARSP